MAWTAPRTFTPASALTAADLNTYVRDNMLESEAAKVLARGDYVVSTGANAVAKRSFGYNYIATSETRTNTAYGNLSTVGPTVTVDTGPLALVLFSAEVACNADTGTARMTVDVTGATTTPGTDTRSLAIDAGAGNRIQAGHAVFFNELTPGTNTFTCKYACSVTGTGTFLYRRLFVLPY